MNGTLLRWVVRLLPGRLADWGQAMQAELASLTGAAERTRFTLGCTLAVLARPVPLVRAGWLFARFMAFVLAVLLAATVSGPTIRLEALAGVAVALVVLTLLPFWLGPTAGQVGVRAVAAGGTAIVLGLLLVALQTLRVPPPQYPYPSHLDPTRTGTEMTGLIVLMTVFLAAVLRATAARSALTPRTVISGGAAALGVAGCWLVLVLIRPETAAANEPSWFCLLGAALVAAGLARGQRVAAALLAVAGAALLIGLTMDVLPLAGHFAVNSAPPSLEWPAPTRVVDTIGMALLGLLSSLILAVGIHRGPVGPDPSEERLALASVAKRPGDSA